MFVVEIDRNNFGFATKITEKQSFKIMNSLPKVCMHSMQPFFACYNVMRRALILAQYATNVCGQKVPEFECAERLNRIILLNVEMRTGKAEEATVLYWAQS